MQRSNFLIFLLFCSISTGWGRSSNGPTVVFEPLEGRYASTRIPALVVTQKGTLLAFASGRIESGSDWAAMDLLMKRSVDGGKNWGKLHVVAERRGGKPTDNPVPIVGHDGTIHLLFQRDYAFAYYIKSVDDGRSWSEPVDITTTFDAFRPEYDWKVLAPGPGHSIQLESGRLLVPVWLANSGKTAPHRSHWPSRIATIYSDDDGKTWNRGALLPEVDGFENPTEHMAVQLPDGRVMLIIRIKSDKQRKGVSYSPDGITGWTPPVYSDDLFEPSCMASVVRIAYDKQEYVLFSNPDSEDIPNHPRQNLTIKLSKDNGKTWPIEKVLNAGSSGYSDLAVGAEGIVYCLYETRNEEKGGVNLVLEEFHVEELLNPATD